MKNFIYFLTTISFIFAEYTISGTVKDNGSKNILPGANVFIQSLGLGAIVDFNGEFELADIPNGTHELTISLISYKNETRKITVTNKDITNIDILLDLAPISKTTIVVEGKQSIKTTLQPVFRIRFNSIYKSFDSPLLPPNLSIDDSDAYENVFLRKSSEPEILLGVSKKMNDYLKGGIVMKKNEFRIFIQSSSIKMELGKINNSTAFSIGGIYRTNNNLNVELDVNIYNIIKNATLNGFGIQNNLTTSITLSTNFD